MKYIVKVVVEVKMEVEAESDEQAENIAESHVLDAVECEALNTDNVKNVDVYSQITSWLD